jgi:hypothetical protein
LSGYPSNFFWQQGTTGAVAQCVDHDNLFVDGIENSVASVQHLPQIDSNRSAFSAYFVSFRKRGESPN